MSATGSSLPEGFHASLGEHQGLDAPARILREQVRVRVPREQQRLEEQHARGPDRGAAAEPRQDQARDQRLHQEQQERRKEDGGAVEH
jgi:hypothetical protein